MELSKFILPLRATQAIFSLIVLSTTAYVSSWWSSYWLDTSPPELNFLVFTSALTLFLVLPYLVFAPRKFNGKFAPRMVILGVECSCLTFWFAGFVALGVFLGGRICFGNVCNVAKAAAAFGGFNWALFAASTILAVVDFIRAKPLGGMEGKVVDDGGSVDEEKKRAVGVTVKEVDDEA